MNVCNRNDLYKRSSSPLQNDVVKKKAKRDYLFNLRLTKSFLPIFFYSYEVVVFVWKAAAFLLILVTSSFPISRE